MSTPSIADRLLFYHLPYMGGCKAVGSIVGGMARGAVGAASGAGIGLATGFVQYPPEVAIDYLTDRRKIPESLGLMAHAINCVASNALVWGGALALGVVSAPVAVGLGSFAAVYGITSKIEDTILKNAGNNIEVAAMFTLAAKVFLIAAALFALIGFGVLAAPAAFSIGAVLVSVAAIGTIYVAVVHSQS